MNYKDPKHVQLMETKLGKGAIHWWRHVQTSGDKAGLPHITKWREMKSELHKRYIPTIYRQDLSKMIASFT